MDLMDKVKEGAAQALTKAQQGVRQGRAKIDEAQAKHQWDGLLRNLGAAVYAEQRQGGSSDAVAAALAALDAQAERVRTSEGDGSEDGSVTEAQADDGDGRVTSQAGEEAAAGPGTAGDETSTGEAGTEG
jgi:hypothetical protein